MKTFLLAAATLAVSTGALAQTPPAGPAQNAPVTRAQALADADRRFQAMDANRDGRISAEERRAYRDSKRDRRPGRELTQAEFRDRAAKRFDRIDTNKDGTIDAQEREAARLLMRARMAGRHAGHGA